MVPDFTGYVTKYGIKCSDGRTIRAHAFAHEDGDQIPLVWQHQHKEATNVLGHLILQHREDGVYAQGFFNDTEQGQNGKALVKHKDVKNLSIYANALQPVSYTHLRAHETRHDLVCRLLLEKKK